MDVIEGTVEEKGIEEEDESSSSTVGLIEKHESYASTRSGEGLTSVEKTYRFRQDAND